MPAKTSIRPESIPVVTLAEVPALAHELAGRVRAAQFQPDLIAYVETGARLLAWELCREFGVKAVAVEASRGGRGLKRLLAPLATALPRRIIDSLRRAEELSGVHRVTNRSVKLPPDLNLEGRSVLLVDDAADTGRTIMAVRAALQSCRHPPAQLRAAVLAATMPEAVRAVDFHLLDRNCCLPWSSDSAEREVARRLAAERRPPAA